MNIVFTGSFSYPSGMAATRRVQVIIDYIESIGIAPKVIILQRKVNGNGRFNLTEYHHIYFLRLILLLILLARWKERQTKNILYVYDGINVQNIGIVILARILDYAIVTDFVEDYYVQQENASFLFRIKINSSLFFERHINKLSNGIIVISTYLERKFIKVTEFKIPIIHIPISAHINKIKSKQEFNNPIQFVYSGSFGNKDGISVLFDAFNQISMKYPDCVLVLTGIGKNLNSIIQLNRNQKIVYAGYLKKGDFYKLIGNADILCMTRNSSSYAAAGFPFKLGDYLATGNPVICSRVSDVELYLENGKDAILVEPDNVESLKNGMEFLIKNQKEAIEIGKNGLEKCKKYFDPAENGKLLYNFLLSI